MIDYTFNENNQKTSVSAIYYLRLQISKVMYGLKVGWEMITSCFGSGIRKSDKPWSNSESWKNN